MSFFDVSSFAADIALIVFHKQLGAFTAYFHEKSIGYKYSEKAVRLTQTAFLLGGIVLFIADLFIRLGY